MQQPQQTQQRLQQQAHAASQASVSQVSISASGSQYHQYQQKQGTAVESDSNAYEQQNRDELHVVRQRGAGRATADDAATDEAAAAVKATADEAAVYEPAHMTATGNEAYKAAATTKAIARLYDG